MAEDVPPAARTTPVATTPVPLLALGAAFGTATALGSSYSQRSSLTSISGSDGCTQSQRTSTTPLQQKQARLRTARQRQLEQRREGVAALMLLHSSLQRACAACRALQRWRRFAETDGPTPAALPSSAAAPATSPAATGRAVAPQSSAPHGASPGVSPERHAAVQHGQTALLGSGPARLLHLLWACHACWPRAARPVGSQPRPQGLEPAASEVLRP